MALWTLYFGLRTKKGKADEGWEYIFNKHPRRGRALCLHEVALVGGTRKLEGAYFYPMI